MQSIPQAFGMEVFLITVVLIFLIALACLNIFHFYRLTQRHQIICDAVCEFIEYSRANNTGLEQTSIEVISIMHIVTKIDRHLSALKELQEPTKPIKPNNWDSVKEAFKGPYRVEINERN